MERGSDLIPGQAKAKPETSEGKGEATTTMSTSSEKGGPVSSFEESVLVTQSIDDVKTFPSSAAQNRIEEVSPESTVTKSAQEPELSEDLPAKSVQKLEDSAVL